MKGMEGYKSKYGSRVLIAGGSKQKENSGKQRDNSGDDKVINEDHGDI